MPNITGISFGGTELPCKVESGSILKKAARKFRKISVPGRNGDIVYQQDAFDNVKIKYRICSGKNSDVNDAWREIAEDLFLDGYQKLKDVTDATHFRLAVFNGPIDAEYYWKQTGRAEIEFDSRPERFLDSGDSYTGYSASPITLTNPTGFAAKPSIQVNITSGGSGTVTIGEKTITITNYPVTYLVLDSESQDARGTNSTNRNKWVSGDYPILEPGDNTVTFSGDITSIRIKPRWWEL